MTDITEAGNNTVERNTGSPNLISTTENEETYKIEIKIWIERAIAYLFFFAIIQISILTEIPNDLSLVPLLFLDIKILVKNYLSTRPFNIVEYMKNGQNIHQISSILFKVMLMLYKNYRLFNGILLPIPAFIAFLNQYFTKVSKTHECKYLAWMIVTVSELLFSLAVLNISLSLERVISSKPSAILWPLYTVMIFGLILYVSLSCNAWIKKVISLSELLSSFWLFGSLTGSLISIVVICASFSYKGYFLKKYFSIVPIIFLILFIAITHTYLKYICEWWKMFFTVSSEADSVPPNPSRAQNFHEKVSATMKKVPRILMRISSSYFKPMDTPQNRKNKRTTSLKFQNEDTMYDHQKRFSIQIRNEILSPTASESYDKLCEMCCERLCNAVIMDCGHGGICYECSLEMWRNAALCHMCRGSISKVLQVKKKDNKLFQVQSFTEAYYPESSNK